MMPSAGPVTLAPVPGLPRSRKPEVGSTAGAKSRNSWAAMLFGASSAVTKLRKSGVSTVNVEPAGAGLPQPFVRGEEEQLVAHDGSAQAVAELVLR